MSASDPLLDLTVEALGMPRESLDVNASFIQNGGDSHNAMLLVAACRKHGLELDIKSVFEYASIERLLKQHPGLVNAKKIKRRPSPARKPKADGPPLANTSKPRPDSHHTAQSHVTRQPAASQEPNHDYSQHYSLTEMQKSLLSGSELNPGRNVIAYCETHKPRDIRRIHSAWKEVIYSEPVFQTGNGNVLFEWRETIVTDADSYQTHIQNQLLPKTTDLTNSFAVFTLNRENPSTGKSCLVWTVHHALIDHDSLGTLLTKFQRVLRGEPISRGIPFSDVAASLAKHQSDNEKIAQEFWRGQTEAHPSTATDLNLPDQDAKSPKEAGTAELVIAPISRVDVMAKARQYNVTAASVYFAAWMMTLSHLTDAESVTTGAVYSGRSLPIQGIETAVGPLINTLPFHWRLDRDMPLKKYLTAIFQHVSRLGQFEWSRPEHGFQRNFTTALSVEAAPHSTTDSVLESLTRPTTHITTDISLALTVEYDGLVRLRYHEDRFSENSIRAVGNLLGTSLIDMCMLDDPTVGTCMSRVLSTSALDDLAALGNFPSVGDAMPAPQYDALPVLFERVAEANPTAVALQKGTETMTYSQLNHNASVVARAISRICKPRDVVGVRADKSLNWIVALFGVHKARCVYAPFDAALPENVRDKNFGLSGSKLFIIGYTQDQSLRPPSAENSLSVEAIVKDPQYTQDLPSDYRTTTGLPSSAPAYLCFTSGSTGTPKGVMCAHAGVAALQQQAQIRLRAKPGWRIAQLMSPSFDGSINEIFSSLTYGATLLLGENDDPFRHLRDADAAMMTPSLAYALDTPILNRLKLLALVGEAVPQDLCDRMAGRIETLNMYGPTEMTCGATLKQLQAGEPVSLGRPFNSMRIYILNSRRELVARGVIGEICLAGVQLSMGYLNMPEQTAKAFVPDTVVSGRRERMYCTGDRAYWDENGELRFLGRKDRQIKHRGFRIDLDDLECRLKDTAPEASRAAIVKHDDDLVAFAEAKNLDVRTLRKRLAMHFPAYALPKKVFVLEEMPLTRVGKIDYKTLVANHMNQGQAQPSAESQPADAIIAQAWREVLSLPDETKLDGSSSFTELGGDSLHYMSLLRKLERLLNKKIPLRLIMESQTLSDLSSGVSALTGEDETRAVAQPRAEYHTTSYMEQLWWRNYKIKAPGSTAFTVSSACRLDATVDLKRLARAWNQTLARHEILNCGYTEDDGEILRASTPGFGRVEMVEDGFDTWQEMHRTFDLTAGKLFRVVLSPSLLLLTASITIADLSSLRILLTEVKALYNDPSASTVPLPAVERLRLPRPALTPEARRFWQKNLKNPPVPYFPPRKTFKGTSRIYRVSKATFSTARDFCKREGFTVHQMALCATALALSRRQAGIDVIMGAPHENRFSLEEKNAQLGLFLQPIPIRLTAGKDVTSHALLTQAKNSSRDSLSYACDWDQLVSLMKARVKAPASPIFDVMVSFFEDLGTAQYLPDGTTPLFTWCEGAKFPLMVELAAASHGGGILRAEYSEECFDGAHEVDLLVERILQGFESLAMGKTVQEIERVMDAAAHGAKVRKHETEQIFQL